MSYATNVGKAIALQTPDRGDYWLRQTAQDLKLQKQAEAKAKADQADKLATIYDIDLKGGYLPAWSKAVRSEYAKFVNQVADLRAQDPNISYAQLIMLKNDTKARIEDLKEQNDVVVNYIGNENLAKDKDWVNAAQTSDDFYEIAKYNNPTYYNVVPETGYTFLNPVKVVAKDIKYPTPQSEKYKNTIYRGGRGYDVYEYVFPDNIEQTISVDLKSNPEYFDYTMWELSQDPANRKLPTESLQDWYARVEPLTNTEIDRRVALARPKPGEKEERLPEAGDGGGGGPKKKNFAMMDGTMNARSASTGKLGKFKTKEKPVYVPNMITLESNGKYIDYTDFREIPEKFVDPVTGKERSITFGFKPDKVIVRNINGKLTKLVRGSLVKSDQGDASPLYEFLGLEAPTNDKWTGTRDILVPYDEVKGLIEGYNDMSDVDQYIQQTQVGTSRASNSTLSIKRSDIASKASARGYTVADYTKELQKRGVKIID